MEGDVGCVLTQTQESNPVAPSNIFHVFSSSFHKPFSCQVALLSFEPHQEIPLGYQTPPNRNVLYVADKDMPQVNNDKYKGYLKLCQY
jgi:hypothetical protein